MAKPGVNMEREFCSHVTKDQYVWAVHLISANILSAPGVPGTEPVM